MTDMPTNEAESAQKVEIVDVVPVAEGAPKPADPWQEVGKQFQALGESLATAFRAAWNDEQNRKRVQEMQHGLESMVKDVGKAIDETAKSTEVQQAKSEAKRAAESLKMATEHTMQEMRPHLVAALHNLNEELVKFVKSMEQPPSKPAEEAKAQPEGPATDQPATKE